MWNDLEWAMDNDIVLEKYDIYPNRYTNVPYASGCYKSEYGKWYYYHSIDERTSLKPNGTKKLEVECFKLLFCDLKYKIQQKQKREEAYAKEFEKSCEALSEKERNEEISARNAWLEEEKLVNFYMPRNQFAKTQEEIVIDLDRIYEGIDSMLDNIFGELEYDFLWEGKTTITMFDKQYEPERIDPGALDKLPVVNNCMDMKDLVTPIKICIPELDDEREVDILFDCAWDFDLGMGVRIVNENVTLVGVQNDVL